MGSLKKVLAVEYDVKLTVVRPVWDAVDAEDEADQVAWLQSLEAKRELEHEVLRWLRKLDGDCDAEVLDVRVIPEYEPYK